MSKQNKNKQVLKTEPVINEDIVINEEETEDIVIEKTYIVKGTFSMTGKNGVFFTEGDIVKASHLVNIEDHVKNGFLKLIK